jgi:elongation factor 2
MKDKTHIRNMGIIAHIDHGKCVSGNTRISFSDGNTYRADEIFNQIKSLSPLVKKTDKEVVYDCSELKREVFSLNKDTGVIETKPLRYVWKLKGGQLLKVKLRTGFEISTTPEHKYLIFDGIDFTEKRADKLQIGDRIISARNTTTRTELNLKESFLKNIGRKSGFYVVLKEEFHLDIHQLITSYGKSQIVRKFSKLSNVAFSSGLSRRRYRLEDIIKICEFFKIQIQTLYDGIETISYRSGQKKKTDPRSLWRGKSSNKSRLPNSFEDFFYLAGLMLGDGTNDKLVVGKPELGDIYERICRDLGLNPSWRRYEGKCPEIISGGGMTLTVILNRLFDYPLKRKSHNIRVSDFVFQSPNQYVASMVRGYFDCDGTVERSRRAISITSASNQMLEDLHILLLRFGCLSQLQGDTLYLSGSAARKFLEKIGFGLKEKEQKLINLTKKSVGSLVTDLIPLDGEVFRQLRGDQSKAQIDPHYYKYENQLYSPTKDTKLLSPDISYVEIIDISDDYAEEVYDFTVEPHKNFVAEGMIIHNTTLSDSLLSASGLLSNSIAGQARALDYLEEEQRRGITIKSANISLLYEEEEDEFVINLIDTPGHVDFSGNVTRALRVIDSAVVVVDAVEEVMVQTETVTKQAVEERVRPLLFINKVDRIIRELKLSPEQFQQKLVKIIKDFNHLIDLYAEPQFKKAWKVDPSKGTVALGSALHGWGFTLPQLSEAGWTFKDLVSAYEEDRRDELKEKFPVHRCILDMVIHHGPNPVEAQKYRLERIWAGDLNSDVGKAMVECADDGPLVICLSNVTIDPHAGIVSTGRVFSGTVKSGSQVYLILGRAGYRVQQTSMYMGSKREVVDRITAGNIVALLGLVNARSGETVVAEGLQEEVKAFEEIRYVSEPVVTIAIEAKKPSDLPKLIETMQKLGVTDPNLKTTINEETGEYLLSGMGELHLEVSIKDIEKMGIPITQSQPIVVYRESTKGKGGPALAKSPNKHNRVWLTVEQMNPATLELIIKGKISNSMDAKERARLLREVGWDAKVARKIWLIDDYTNMMVDATKGVQFLREIKDNFLNGWSDATSQGPLSREPIRGCVFRLTDVKLHEDSIHRGPAQIIPPARSATYGAFLLSEPSLLEPVYKVQIQVPQDYVGAVTGVINQRRGQVRNIEQKGEQSVVTGEMPVAETFGLATDLRSKTSGHAFWQTQFSHWSDVPKSLLLDVISSIRVRKGLPEKVPPATDYVDKL